jgi:hypothetical protein
MKPATLISALFALASAPLALRAQQSETAFIDSLVSLKTAETAVPEAAPTAVKEEAPAKTAGVKERYDPEPGKTGRRGRGRQHRRF